MKAPEKLYLHPTAKGEVGANWLTFQLTNEDVEYIQKDAFIEKACEWLNDNMHHYWGSISADPHNFLFDFRKVMEE